MSQFKLNVGAACSVRERHLRAEARSQLMANKPVLNTQVVPHWIGLSDHVRYERQTPGGREYRLVDAKLICAPAASPMRRSAAPASASIPLP